MDIATLNSGLRAAITAYGSTINTWAQDKYSTDHTFISRADVRDSPGADDCPCCALTPYLKEMGQESRIHMVGFTIDVMVNDASSSGFDNLEAYRLLLQSCIAGYIASQNLTIVDIAVAYNITDSYPMLWCGMQVKFKEYKTLGQNPIM